MAAEVRELSQNPIAGALAQALKWRHREVFPAAGTPHSTTRHLCAWPLSSSLLNQAFCQLDCRGPNPNGASVGESLSISRGEAGPLMLYLLGMAWAGLVVVTANGMAVRSWPSAARPVNTLCCYPLTTSGRTSRWSPGCWCVPSKPGTKHYHLPPQAEEDLNSFLTEA